MKISLLNLISTPVAVLNSLEVGTRVGLSSEDPKLQRLPSEEYQVYATVYSTEGVFLGREHVGAISPHRRKFFNISEISKKYVMGSDHLCVVHRVPNSLLSEVDNVEELVEADSVPDYSLFRSLVEYSYPGGGNASIIYETPPGMNVISPGKRPSQTLSFTSKIVISELVNSYVLLINYSMDPSYSSVCENNFAVHSMDGAEVVRDKVSVGPFSARIIDLGRNIPANIIESERDPMDGLSTFSYVGFSDQGSNITIIINAAKELEAISMEHCHAAQEYLLPHKFEEKRLIKSKAVVEWKTRLGGA